MKLAFFIIALFCAFAEGLELHSYSHSKDISADFEYYDNCQSMLKDLTKEKHYIKEYNLIPTDESSNLYAITDEDVNIMKKIFTSVNKKYV